jgi:hypothetical protein
MNVRKTVLSVLGAVTCINLFATMANAQVPESHPMSVNHRLQRQNRRINAGLATGTLRVGQADRLRARDARIRARADVDRGRNGGVLTPREHGRMERRLNHVSKRIYTDKHS